MNRFLLKPSASLLLLTLGVTGCAMPPFASPPSPSTQSATKAPVTDRSARQAPAYPNQSAPQPYPSPDTEVGQLPREDPLIPREYAAGAPTYPTESYPAPAPRPSGNYAPPARPPTAGSTYQPPAYPPGAAYTPHAAAPPAPKPAAPMPNLAPRPQPVTPRPTAPESAQKAVAATPPVAAANPPPTSTPPPAPEKPVAPRPAPPPPRPADLPPAEITREGNQAVVALLDSADKYVKSNQLDKAGAALERALRIEPRNAGIWHDLAQIRLHQGQYPQAESLASKSNNLSGGNRALQSRNWKLISVARKAGGNPSGAEEAEAQATLLAR